MNKVQERVLSRLWYLPRPPHAQAIAAFFAHTDKGIKPEASESQEWWGDYIELWRNHKFLPVVIEYWRKDFHEGLLFPLDFVEERPSMKKLGLDIYASELGETWHVQLCRVLKKRRDVIKVIGMRHFGKIFPGM